MTKRCQFHNSSFLRLKGGIRPGRHIRHFACALILQQRQTQETCRQPRHYHYTRESRTRQLISAKFYNRQQIWIFAKCGKYGMLIIKCPLGVSYAPVFAADFPPEMSEFHQRTHRIRLKNSGTSDKKPLVNSGTMRFREHIKMSEGKIVCPL